MNQIGTDNAETGEIIGAAIEVHRELGPGLLESAYEACFASELMLREIRFIRQRELPLHYKGTATECIYRLDFLVAERVIVEIKAVRALEQIHTAQLLTYMKLARCSLGLLINFNVPILRTGIRRLIL